MKWHGKKDLYNHIIRNRIFQIYFSKLLGKEANYMYVYHLLHEHDGQIKTIGYFGSWRKARRVMKIYRANVLGFKDYPNGFLIRKKKINKDNYYFI